MSRNLFATDKASTVSTVVGLASGLVGISLGAVATTSNFTSLPSGPTEYEQYMLELLNRARADPNAEVTRLSGLAWDGAPDLNEGPPSTVISSVAKQPLAFNQALIDASRNHVAWNLLSESFNHNEGAAPVPNTVNWTGNTPGDRVVAAGYGSSSVGENSAVGVSSSSTAFTSTTSITTAARDRHNSLFIDRSFPGRGHRLNFMNAAYTEVGIGFFTDDNYKGPFASSFARANLANYNFGSFSQGIITGVVYNDLDGNAFYTPENGEAMGGVIVKAFQGGLLIGSATTWSSGGYSLTGLTPGTYDLVFERAGETYVVGPTVLGIENVKVDAINPIFIPEPSTLLFVILSLGSTLIRRSRSGEIEVGS